MIAKCEVAQYNTIEIEVNKMGECVFENRRPYSNAEREMTSERTEPRKAKEMYHDSQSVLSFPLNSNWKWINEVVWEL